MTATMIPVKVTVRARNIRTGRTEMWAAESRDGDWYFERLDEAGTPWLAVHRPTGHVAGQYGSLPAARRYAAGQFGLDFAYAVIDGLGCRPPRPAMKVWVA